MIGSKTAMVSKYSTAKSKISPPADETHMAMMIGYHPVPRIARSVAIIPRDKKRRRQDNDYKCGHRSCLESWCGRFEDIEHVRRVGQDHHGEDVPETGCGQC